MRDFYNKLLFSTRTTFHDDPCIHSIGLFHELHHLIRLIFVDQQQVEYALRRENVL